MTEENSNTFSYAIESIASKSDITLIDAILEYCQKNNMEIEVAVSLINKNLKSKIQYEAENLNFLEKSERLPL